MFQRKMRGENQCQFLTQPALSMLIDRLFAEADAAENARWPATGASDRSDYRQHYGLLKDQHVVRHFDAASGGSAPG
jgi:hypothetical protein